MIKIISNFLPQTLFNYLLKIVENENFDWNWNNETIRGDGEWKMGKTLYAYPGLSSFRQEVYDKELLPLFGVIKDFQDEQLENKYNLIKLKLNLYPNQGKQVKHGIHTDITSNGKPDRNVITSVFNFHTCNGYTNIIKDDGSEKNIPSIANSIVIFSGFLQHYGVTQSDTTRRIVLNMNVLKNDSI